MKQYLIQYAIFGIVVLLGIMLQQKWVDASTIATSLYCYGGVFLLFNTYLVVRKVMGSLNPPNGTTLHQ